MLNILGGFCACHAKVPKVIVIENWKVGLLLKILQGSVVCLIFAMVVVNESWLQEIPQADFQGGLTFWASPSPLAEYTGNSTRDLKQDWCMTPEKYNYKYDENFVYLNYSCVGLPPHERWIKGETEMYLPVSFYEQYMFSTNFPKERILPGNCESALQELTPCAKGWKTLPRGFFLLGCECEMTGGNYFVSGVAALSLGMELFYNVKSDSDGQSEGFSTKAKSLENGEEKDGLLVILRDQFGKTVQQFQPGGGHAVNIPVLNLLQYAGVNLDDTMDNTLENSIPGATLTYPTLRMTGVTISAHITYMNTYSDHKTDWTGPVAVIGLSHQKIWSRKPVTEHDKPLAQIVPEGENSFQVGQYRYRHYSGIRIKFSSSGIWKKADVFSFLGTVGQSVPFMYFPVLIVSFLALNCLGPLAKVYKRAGQQRVGLRGHKGNAAVRMVVAANAYDQMKGSDATLSRHKLHEEMHRILQDFHVHEDDTADYVVKQMFNEMDVDQNGDVSLQEFMEAAIGHDCIGPKELTECHMQASSGNFHHKALFSEGSLATITPKTKVVPVIPSQQSDIESPAPTPSRSMTT